MSKRKMVGIVQKIYQNRSLVSVEKIFSHPKYKKKVKIFSKYAACSAGLDVLIGDVVEIQESVPISKTIKWIITRKV